MSNADARRVEYLLMLLEAILDDERPESYADARIQLPLALNSSDEDGDWMGVDNAIFIAAARTDVPALVAEVRKWKAAAEASRALLEYGATVANGEATRLDTHMRLAAYDRAWKDLS